MATRDAKVRISVEIMSAIIVLISPAAMRLSLNAGLSCTVSQGRVLVGIIEINNQIGRKTAARTIGVWRERRLARHRHMAWFLPPFMSKFVE